MGMGTISSDIDCLSEMLNIFFKGYSSLSVKTFKILSTIKWINCGGNHLKIIEFRGFPQHQTSGDIFN